MARSIQILILVLGLSASIPSLAEDKPAGYLCCNMRSDGSWISDINYQDNGNIIPVGTPLKVIGYGRYRVKVEINGKKQEIGDDYSRDLALDVFAKRYVVADDPTAKIATYPKKIQDAVARAKIVLGMTREQVLMSVGASGSAAIRNSRSASTIPGGSPKSRAMPTPGTRS